MSEVPQRVRVICFDPGGAVLLMKWRDPVDGRIFWEPPGGGIEPGETSRQAAARELHEETSLVVDLGPRSVLVDRDYRWAGRRHVHVEEFFRAETDTADVRLERPTDEELATFVEWRFVRPDELGGLDAPLEPPLLEAVLRQWDVPH
jgi:8-oxo-dGTP diphosphatase